MEKEKGLLRPRRRSTTPMELSSSMLPAKQLFLLVTHHILLLGSFFKKIISFHFKCMIISNSFHKIEIFFQSMNHILLLSTIYILAQCQTLFCLFLVSAYAEVNGIGIFSFK